ncbi:MAG: minor capsid protein [Blautia sp.]|nr:minor capsid protein [Blautia sp.]
MKRSDGYWERRAAERMHEDMERAERVADQIADVYQKTAVYLTGQAKKVFDKFRREHGLTEKQAKALLNKARSRKDLDKLLHEISTRAVTDEEREAIYRILEAPAYAARISRLEDIMSQVDQVMGAVYKQEVPLNRDFYIQLAKDAYYHTIYDIQQRAGAAFSFAHVSRKQINNTLQMPWSGKNYSTRIWDNTQKLADLLKIEMVVSLITGRTDRETTKVIQEAMGAGAMQSRRLVRTEAAHVSSDFTLRSYKECGIENYRYVAILDLKTSEVCRELDGQEFPVEEAKTGENYPPMHPWCRSTTIAAPTPEQLKTMKRRARDPVTGKSMLVPMSMTYKEWYTEYVEGKVEVEAKEKGVGKNAKAKDETTLKKHGKADEKKADKGMKSEPELKSEPESKSESVMKPEVASKPEPDFGTQEWLDENGIPWKDVTLEYERTATPGQGSLFFEEGFEDVMNEKENAQWIFETYGGSVVGLKRWDEKKSPDFLWNGKLWDLKTVTTEKSANSAIRGGLQQIADNPGGVMLYYKNQKDISEKELISVITKRMKWCKQRRVDILVRFMGRVLIMRFEND